MNQLASHPPGFVDRVLQRVITARQVLYKGAFVSRYQLECSVCGFKGLFRWAGNPPRRDAACPKCRSLERHRLLKLWFDRNAERLRGGTALHFACEPGVISFVRPAAGTYVTADIQPGRADRVLDIQDMPTEHDASYDWIIASHVLEHVDDRKALAELHRVLKPGGLLIIMIPIIEGWPTTYENAQVTSREDRERLFGQHDHVRFYGRDVRDRIAAAGFTLEEFTAEPPMVSRYSLTRGETVFVAVKPA